jgi:hypothetical protein
LGSGDGFTQSANTRQTALAPILFGLAIHPDLGDVSHDIFDRINRIGFAKVTRGVVALVDNCAEFPRPF